MTSSPDISVIVPTRNRVRSLKRTLESLARQVAGTGSFEVVVVVNDSHDDTPAQLSALRFSYDLRLVEIPMPGMSRARNTGAALARGSILVFLDDDIEVLPEFVGAHGRAHPEVSALVAVGTLHAPDTPGARDPLAKRLQRLDDAFAALLGRSETLDAFCMIGGNMSLSRTLFERVGGFDTTLAAYGGEDYEFGLRAERAGARFAFVPEAGGFHHARENTSLGSYLANARSIGRNDIEIARKHSAAIDRLGLSRAASGRTPLGRAARILAFDRPRVGDLAAECLLGVATVLDLMYWHSPWNRLVDALRDYWYFRGAADQVGSRAGLERYLDELRAASPGRD